MENTFINGLPNKAIANKIVPNRIKKHTVSQYQKITHPVYHFVKTEMNAYIGNPN